jgi:hypothetical protein
MITAPTLKAEGMAGKNKKGPCHKQKFLFNRSSKTLVQKIYCLIFTHCLLNNFPFSDETILVDKYNLIF